MPNERAVPLIGEKAQVNPDGTKVYGPFGIAGWALAFSEPPDTATEKYTRWIEEGGQPPIYFVLMWTRASIHLEHHDRVIDQLQKRVRVLEKRLGIAAERKEGN
jgi:hypothetical protein